MKNVTPTIAVLVALFSGHSIAGKSRAQPEPTAQPVPASITLDQIMADPDWIARSPENPYFLDDPKTLYWRQKDEGSDERPLYMTRLAGPLDGQPPVHEKVPLGQMYLAELRGGDTSPDGLYRVTSRAGDIFLISRRSGDITQITSTSDNENSPRFVYDASSRPRRIMYTRGGQWYTRDLDTGAERQFPAIKTGKKPQPEDKPPEGLAAGEDRLFEFVREQREQRQARRERTEAARAADPARIPEDVFVAEEGEIFEAEPSPRADWVFVSFGTRGKPGKGDLMPVFVNESGYVESRSVRSKVGTGSRTSQKAALVRLSDGMVVPIDVSGLSMMGDDPLAFLKKKPEPTEEKDKESPTEENTPENAEQPKPETNDAEPRDNAKPRRGNDKAAPRSVRFSRVMFNHDGTRLAFQVLSNDNKDRWVCTIDLDALSASPEKAVPNEVEHLRDEAWINGRFSEMSWIDKTHSLWFLSEKTGYSHLYLHDAKAASTLALTSGDYEVFDVESDDLGRYLYFHSNESHPGSVTCERVELSTRAVERIIDMPGQSRAVLSPDGSLLAFTNSEMLSPPELYIQRAQPGATPIRLTQTASAQFSSLPWQTPTIIEIPGPAGVIYARLYRPVGDHEGPRPAAFFVHGAGYLQNAHFGWSSYFREMMFNQMLARDGFVVLDMDYRASSGYGRDWRTAIYRDMGTPEIEDLKACINHLAEHENVDRARVGVYGGSYGGFVTLIAMFREPGLFRAGAALRPVTDWAHYNDGYTANILNTPELDPEAYKRSSPIEYADHFDGSRGELLICHGMVDDNVFFQDTVRLAQRLIELKKTNWNVAMYPVEAHAFTEPDSWYDEYRRIYELFTEELRP